MNKIKIIFLFFITFIITGCWNYNELNDLAITTAIGIDKVDNEYEVSILIANSQNKQSNYEEDESETIVYSAKGKTVSEAFKNIDLENPKQTYIGHLSAVIIDEDIAKEGIVSVLDFLFRNAESTKRFYIAIAKDYNAKDIIKIISPLEAFPAQTISTNIKSSSESQSVSTEVIYSKFIETMMKKGIEPILPTITIEGNEKDGSKETNLEQSEPNATIKLGPLAIFKNDQLVDYATDDESQGINFILNKVSTIFIQYKCEENFIVIEINDVKPKINIDINNNIASAKMHFKTYGNIIENNCKIDLNDPKTINKIEKDTKKQIKTLIKKGMRFSQKDVKVDILGFGNKLYQKNPNFFKSIDDWNNYFSKMNYEINVDVKINNKGSIKQSLKEAINEN